MLNYPWTLCSFGRAEGEDPVPHVSELKFGSLNIYPECVPYDLMLWVQEPYIEGSLGDLHRDQSPLHYLP
jgi:hypothetical protein